MKLGLNSPSPRQRIWPKDSKIFLEKDVLLKQDHENFILIFGDRSKQVWVEGFILWFKMNEVFSFFQNYIIGYSFNITLRNV